MADKNSQKIQKLKTGIGNTLRSHREAHKKSQHWLAAKSETSQSTISKIECGKLMPELETLVAICTVLNVSIPLFFHEAYQ